MNKIVNNNYENRITTLQKIKSSTNSINFKMFFALLLMGLVPTVWTTLRIFWIGQMPDGYNLSIAAQLEWVELIYEIVQEAFILPLFFFIGKAYSDMQKVSTDVSNCNLNFNNDIINSSTSNSNFDKASIELSNRVRTGLLIVFCFYLIVSIIVIVFARPLVKFMGQDISLVEQTVTYIRFETVAAIFITLVKFVTVVLVTIKKEKYLYLILGLQIGLTVVFDLFFISSLSVSAKLGVNGIAISNIFVNLLLFSLALYLLYREEIKVFSKQRLCFLWTKGWAKVGGLSGTESFVRNLAFMLMIVRMVNMVGEQGTFWVANNFIWGWLLLPVLQLGELVKRDCGEDACIAIKQKTLGYFAYTAIFVFIWIVSIPLWKPFFGQVLQLQNVDKVFDICLLSLAFYVLFAFKNVLDSMFYGIGKTQYMLYQSLIINIVFYGFMFILYTTGIYIPTLMNVALMFATITGLGSILTFIIFGWMKKRDKLFL